MQKTSESHFDHDRPAARIVVKRRPFGYQGRMPRATRRPTLTSMAKELSLSTCTVSKILSDTMEGISYAPETVRRVKSHAARRGYVPNPYARSLRTKRSMTIAMVIPGGMPFFTGPLVEHVEGALRGRGYETFVGHSTSDTAGERRLIRALLARGVDGLLWIPYADRLRPADLRLEKGFPLVVLDRPGCTNRFPTVVTDNFAASRELAAAIAKSGVARVCLLGSDCGDRSLLDRERGVREVFGRGVRVTRTANTVADARRAAGRLLEGLNGRTLICLTQMLALGALHAMRDRGMRVGREVSFACFDDLPFGGIWAPDVCRIEQDIEAIAQESVRLLLERIRKPSVKQPLVVRVPARFVRGDSVVPGG